MNKIQKPAKRKFYLKLLCAGIMLIAGALSGQDSLNVRFVGNWPFGDAYAITFDVYRNLCLLGSGGGVYVLDLSNPSNPTNVSEIRTKCFVCDRFL